MKKLGLWVVAAAGCASCLAFQAQAASPPSPDERIAKVAPLLNKALRAKLRDTRPVIHWIGATDRFWMIRHEAGAVHYVVVDAAKGEMKPAFDHEALAAALGAATGDTVSAAALPISDLDLEQDARPVVTTEGGVFACDVAARRCKQQPAAPAAAAGLVLSPDGAHGVFKRGDDLWLREVATGRERQLTHDGVENFAYGDYDGYIDTEKVARRRAGEPAPLFGVVWSPDSRYVLGLRQDLRQTPERLLVTEYLPPEGGSPVVYQRRAPMSGDAKRPDSALTLIDTKTGAARAVAMDPQALNDWALPYFAASPAIWWRPSDKAVFLIGASRGGTRYQLLRIDVETGAVRPVITESGRFSVRLNTFDYALPNVRVLSSGREAVWYSERDGYGHLYLYDLTTGQVVRQLTKGQWGVADGVRVDEHARVVYFTATGREPGRHPDYRSLYKVSLDGGEPTLLTPENADHEFNRGYEFWDGGPWAGSSMSPTGRYFVDNASTADATPRLVIRDSDGRLIRELIKPDPGVFARLGVRAPELVTAKAADGVTDLYGVIFKPSDFDPRKSYPVIELTYPGPQGRTAPVTFPEFFTGADIMDPFATAELGFIVVVVDGRGTAYRSRAFREAFFGTEDVFGSADHVAALRDLARTRPYLDLSRIGVTGHSYGGYGTLRAMLLNPDFYKAGVAGVGPADWTEFPDPVSTERYFGDPTVSPQAKDYYQTTSNVRLAANLKAPLLLIYGGVDEIVPLKEAFKLSDAFVKARKPFDLLIVPNSGHAAGREPYGLTQTLRFFIRELGGPKDVPAAP